MTFIAGVSHSEHGPPGAQLPHGRFSKAEIESVGWLVGRTIAEVERELICATLADCHGNEPGLPVCWTSRSGHYATKFTRIKAGA
jgi:hypothetical protein